MHPYLRSIGIALAMPLLAGAAPPAPATSSTAVGPPTAISQAALRALIYMPQRASPPDADMPSFERVTIDTADGEHLATWWRPPAPGKPTFIYFTGNGGGPSTSQARWKILARAGAGFLGVAYRGYEGSSGSPTEVGLHEDARASYDWLAKRVDPKTIIIDGYSLGTAVALKLATERPAKGLVLEAPMTSIEDLGRLSYPQLTGIVLEDRFPSRDWMASLKMPLLIIHGDADQTVPFSMGKEMFSLAPQPKTFVQVPDAEHSTLLQAGALDEVLRFAGLPPATTTATGPAPPKLIITPAK